MASRESFKLSVVLDATGYGSVEFTARGDIDVWHTSVRVAPVPPRTTPNLIPTAEVNLNGDPFEGSQTGSFDSSDTRHLMLAGDILACEWTGGDPGATAMLAFRGIQYPAGQGMAAVAKQ